METFAHVILDQVVSPDYKFILLCMPQSLFKVLSILLTLVVMALSRAGVWSSLSWACSNPLNSIHYVPYHLT